MKNPEYQISNNSQAKYLIIVAHGAGAGMDHPFMEELAGEISSLHGTVIRFNFPYISQGRKMPGSPKEAIAAIQKIYDHARIAFPGLPVILAGKSYGGRMNSHWVTGHPDADVCGLIYLGFPLHPPGKASTARAEHLSQIRLPQLFIQGTNDSLANYEMISGVADGLEQATLHTIPGGDHSFKVPKKTGRAYKEIIKEIAHVADQWAIRHIRN